MNNNFQQEKSTLIKEIIDSEGYNPKTQFINMDKLWETPKRLENVGKLVATFLTKIVGSKVPSSIVAFDNLTFPYGPIPIIAQVSTILDIPLCIVKEGADPITGNHRIYGNCDENKSLLFYDVTRFGLTALRMLTFLHSEGIRPQTFATLVDSNQGGIDLLKKESAEKIGAKIDFFSFIELNEISKAYDKGMER